MKARQEGVPGKRTSKKLKRDTRHSFSHDAIHESGTTTDHCSFLGHKRLAAGPCPGKAEGVTTASASLLAEGHMRDQTLLAHLSITEGALRNERDQIAHQLELVRQLRAEGHSHSRGQGVASVDERRVVSARTPSRIADGTARPFHDGSAPRAP